MPVRSRLLFAYALLLTGAAQAAACGTDEDVSGAAQEAEAASPPLVVGTAAPRAATAREDEAPALRARIAELEAQLATCQAAQPPMQPTGSAPASTGAMEPIPEGVDVPEGVEAPEPAEEEQAEQWEEDPPPRSWRGDDGSLLDVPFDMLDF